MKLKEWQNIFYVNANSIVHDVRKWNNKPCQCECKKYRTCKKN